MKNLQKVFDWFKRSNYMPYLQWNKFLQDFSEEEKTILLKWLEDNNLGISPQATMGIFLLIDKNTLQHLSSKDIMRIAPSWYNSKEEIIKKPIQTNTIICNNFDNDFGDMIGWLDNKGNFHETDWGEHESFAGEYIRSNGLREKYNEFIKTSLSNYRRDFLVSELKWVLLDCPANNGYLCITYNKLCKAQKKFLEKYLCAILDYDTLNKIM